MLTRDDADVLTEAKLDSATRSVADPRFVRPSGLGIRSIDTSTSMVERWLKSPQLSLKSDER